MEHFRFTSFQSPSSWHLLGRTVRAAAAPSHRGREQPHFFFICDDNLVQTHERVTFSPPPPSPPSPPHPARDRRFHRDLDERRRERECGTDGLALFNYCFLGVGRRTDVPRCASNLPLLPSLLHSAVSHSEFGLHPEYLCDRRRDGYCTRVIAARPHPLH